MVRSSIGHQRRRIPLISPVLRPRLWSALLGLVVAAAMATPAYAEPPLPSAVPDTGSRPVVAGALQLPGAGVTPGPGQPPGLISGPLAAQLYAAELRVATLGQQLRELQQTMTDATTQRDTANRDLLAAQAALAKAQESAAQAAAEAFKDAAALPPGQYGSDLYGLRMLRQLQRGVQPGNQTTAAAGEVARASAAVQLATQALTTTQQRADTTARDFSAAQLTYRAEENKLIKLRADNTAQVIELEKLQEAAEQQLGAGYGDGQSVAGMKANPRALAAVNYALRQVGDPYVWAAEGPDAFDCSGLMWAAYRSKGADYQLPRVAKDQYYATRGNTVNRSALLPGDLIFFASSSDWRSVYHVGMYVGGGKMVQAPTTGEKVKISTVRWSSFYAATRVFPAVPAPTTPPATTPPHTTPPTTTPPHTTPPATTPPATTPPATTPATTPPATTPPATTPPATTPPATTPPPTMPTPDPSRTSLAPSESVSASGT